MSAKNIAFSMIFLVIGIVIGVGAIMILDSNEPIINNSTITPIITNDSSGQISIPSNPESIKQFNSFTELNNFFGISSILGGSSSGSSTQATNTLVERDVDVVSESVSFSSPSSGGGASGGSSGGGGASSYSTTNIQVGGVDEADLMKNDNEYIYSVAGNEVVIIKSYPPESMKVISRIDVAEVNNLFINEDKLILIAPINKYVRYDGVRCLGFSSCGGTYERSVKVYIYDVKDRENPKLENSYSIDGSYVNARMIDGTVYIISNNYVNSRDPRIPIYEINGQEFDISIDDIYYFEKYEESYSFTSVSSIDSNNGDFKNKFYLIGSSSEIYVSENNIYLTMNEYMDYNDYKTKVVKEGIIPILPPPEQARIEEILNSNVSDYKKIDSIGIIVEAYANTTDYDLFEELLIESVMKVRKIIEKERQKTIIHKIEINKGEIKHKATGSVPGYVLNQFSMDESGDEFRIATTVRANWWWGNTRMNSSNGLYVLDDDLELMGSVEDLASGETIYSTRFLGDRAYMVTFRQVDPLFVIDISNGNNPNVLGFLKITGVSEYLHPYDENHLIGIGREASETGRFGGLKISLFDVTDVTNPTEKAKLTIGDRGTTSEVFQDHKAFLFDKERNLLAFPVSLAEINETRYSEEGREIPTWAWGTTVWRGMMIFYIDDDKIRERAKIDHKWTDDSYYRYNSLGRPIRRSLYMDNSFYTVSERMVKANQLSALATEQGSIYFWDEEANKVSNNNYRYY